MSRLSLERLSGFLVVVLSGLVANSVSSAALTPVLQFDFNTMGSTAQKSTGSDAEVLTTYSGVTSQPADLVTGSATGPSGQSGDLSLNIGAATSRNIAENQTSIAGDGTLNSLAAFTITAWVNNTAPTGTLETVFALGGSGFGITFGLYSSSNAVPNTEYLKIDNVSTVASPQLPAVTNQWTFIGVTRDYSTGNVTYYTGSTTPGTVKVNGGVVSNSNQVPTNNAFLGIGDNNMGSASQIQGNVDDVQVFNGVASLSQMGAIHDMDLPEPGGLSIFGISLLAAARWRPRQ